MTAITDFARLVPREHGLCVVSTLRPDGTIQSSVVNAGVLDHPIQRCALAGSNLACLPSALYSWGRLRRTSCQFAWRRSTSV